MEQETEEKSSGRVFWIENRHIQCFFNRIIIAILSSSFRGGRKKKQKGVDRCLISTNIEHETPSLSIICVESPTGNKIILVLILTL